MGVFYAVAFSPLRRISTIGKVNAAGELAGTTGCFGATGEIRW